MPENRLSNLGKDLKKAKQQALLIEVLQNDLDSWADQSADIFKIVCDASAAVFDSDMKMDKTNVLAVGREDHESSSIFGSLLSILDNEFDDLHKREILNRLTGFGLSQTLGGGIADAVGDTLNVGTEKMMDYLAEWTGSASDYLASFTEMATEIAAEQSSDPLEFIGEKGVESIAGQFSSHNEIHLSRLARRRFKELTPRLREEATSHETLQLALEMLLVTAQGAPKVIVVKDPLRLDDASLALLAMLVSLEKDLRQVSHAEELGQDRAQTAGISVVLAFTGLQPHDTVKNKDAAEKQRAISRLRMMASRYSLLERLDSDIPVPAVRASTFVGRETELKRLWQDWIALGEQTVSTAPRQAWALIKGEPGTGKTALANRFIQQIRSDANNPACLSIPVLRMLNQTGHSAQATGLASLKDSIADELRRLTVIHEENVGWFSRFGQKVTEGARALGKDVRSDDPEAKKRTRGRIGKVIYKLVGVDAALEVARSTKAWSEQGEMLSMSEQNFAQSSQGNHKEEQYELLREALREIRKLAWECSPENKGQSKENRAPLLLLVDDLQWVDDFTAEFLLRGWPNDTPVLIIATARGSDSFTTTGEPGRQQALNHYRNRLFAELRLIDKTPDDSEQESRYVQESEIDGREKTGLSLASRLELKGMDHSMLANLIKMTYAGITGKQAEQFAASVIKNLSGGNSTFEVTTLFAIEALNVISDFHFYQRNPDLPHLIEPIPATGRYRFKAPENTALAELLDKVFKNLSDTYQASYLVEAGQRWVENSFNLASYAVLEERMHLIEQYFGEHGGTARYSLLFSALLGSPFQSGLVRHVLEDLKQVSPEQHPDLAPFVELLQKNVVGNLEPAQYELLERAYEIIRRLEENTGRYVLQHSLLQQFLLGQLTQLLDRIWPEPEVLENGVGELSCQIQDSVNEWFVNQPRESMNGLSGDGALMLERSLLLVALWGFGYRSTRRENSEYDIWAELYANSLTELGVTHTNLGYPENAVPPHEKALQIKRIGYGLDPLRRREDYALSLNNLAFVHSKLGRPKDALHLNEEALTVLQEGYELDSEHWGESYATTMSNLALNYTKLGCPDDAVSLHEKALEIQREGYQSNSVRWMKSYATSLNNLALAYSTLGRFDNALSLQEEAVEIQRKGYELDPVRWAGNYASSLSNLGLTLINLGRPQGALSLHEKALEIEREGFKLDPVRGAEGYASSLNNLGLTFTHLNRPNDALPLYKKTLEIQQEGYRSNPERWREGYAVTMTNQALALVLLGRLEEALPVQEATLLVFREGYELNPKRWAEKYAFSLSALAVTKVNSGYPEDALLLYKKAEEIQREGYQLDPARWAENYAATLNNQALALSNLERAEDALPLHEEALLIVQKGYEQEPERWAEAYAISLTSMASTYDKIGRSKDALRLIEEAQSIRGKG